MSTLSWNCRGLSNPRTVQELVDLVSMTKPSFIFLMEVKVGRAQVEKIKTRLGFEGLFFMDRAGIGDGVCLMWRNMTIASLISFSQNHIDIIVQIEGMERWRLTGFYGMPERNHRRDSWSLLRSLKCKSQLPWCIIGDLNDLLLQSGKRGNTPHPNYLLNGFRQAVESCNLLDIGMQGYPFTWERGRGMGNRVEERLDRVLATGDWITYFSNTVVCNILTVASDHLALFLEFVVNSLVRKHRFRFENLWLREEECREVVTKLWLDSQGGCIQSRIKACGEGLHEWGNGIRMIFKNKIRSC